MKSRRSVGLIGDFEEGRLNVMRKQLTDEDLDRLLEDRIKARPRKDCFLYASMVYDYAVKVGLGDVGRLSATKEHVVTNHLQGCAYCHYRYLDLVHQLRMTGHEELLEAEASASKEVIQEARPKVDEIISEIKDKITTFTESLRVESANVIPDAILEVSLASPLPAMSNVRELVVRTEKLNLLAVKPYIRIDVMKDEDETKVNFMLLRLRDPDHAAGLEPKEGSIHISVTRQGTDEKLAVYLGTRQDGRFIRSFGRRIRNYKDDEEQQWSVEITVRPGVRWVPPLPRR